MLAEGEDTVPESGEDLTVGATHGLSHRTNENSLGLNCKQFSVWKFRISKQ